MTLKCKADVPSYVHSFHPHFGQVLSDGNLIIPWSGGEGGELLDGSVVVSPDYPYYEEWFEAIGNKENYLKEERQKKIQARAERREQYKIKQNGAA